MSTSSGTKIEDKVTLDTRFGNHVKIRTLYEAFGADVKYYQESDMSVFTFINKKNGKEYKITAYLKNVQDNEYFHGYVTDMYMGTAISTVNLLYYQGSLYVLPEDLLTIFGYDNVQMNDVGNGRTEFTFVRSISIGTDGTINPTRVQAINYITMLCNEHGIPVELGLATAMTESGMQQFYANGNPVINENKVNGNVDSTDWGLFQINDKWNPQLFDGTYGDIKNNWHANVRAGIAKLKECYEGAKNHGYSGDDLLKATYSNYNSGSFSNYKNPNHAAYQNTANFWNNYYNKTWM